MFTKAHDYKRTAYALTPSREAPDSVLALVGRCCAQHIRVLFGGTDSGVNSHNRVYTRYFKVVHPRMSYAMLVFCTPSKMDAAVLFNRADSCIR